MAQCDSPQDHIHTNGHLHSPPIVNGNVPTQTGIMRELTQFSVDNDSYRINGFKQEPILEADPTTY